MIRGRQSRSEGLTGPTLENENLDFLNYSKAA